MVSMLERYVSNNYRDAAEKMAGVIGNYKGEWVYLSNWIRETPSAEVAFIHPDKLHDRQRIDFSKVKAADFSFGPYSLGFCEVNNELYYASRDPVRKNKFGLREDNISWALVATSIDIDGVLRRSPFSPAWREGSLHKMLSGKYDGLKKAIAKFKALSVLYAPINRDFALVRVGLRLAPL